MTWQTGRLSALACAVGAALLLTGNLTAAEDKKPTKVEPSFGMLKGPSAEESRKAAETWLKETAKKTDAATQAQVKTLWDSDRPLLDKVAGTLALGNPDAARLLAEARNPDGPAPTEIPALLKDSKQSSFFRANLALAYARALTSRRVYEEALETFALIKPDDVLDPGVLLFHQAVCEHALMLKDRADTSIDRLLVDVLDAPERYRMVAALMHFDMVTWQEKDLGWIARKMENIHRRLDLKRGGKQTQTIQKEVLVRLDEIIKEMENKQKGGGGGGDGNDGNCPNGGPGPDAPGNQPQSQRPQDDTRGGTASTEGKVDPKKVKEYADLWGKLPEAERAKILVELTRGMPAQERAVIEGYFKELQKKSGK